MSLSMESHRCPPGSTQTGFSLDMCGARASHEGLTAKRWNLFKALVVNWVNDWVLSAALAGGRRAGNHFLRKI